MSVLQWLRTRDPGLAALRRACRAAVVVPGMFAIGHEVIGNPTVAIFAAFGSIGSLIFVEFGGPIRDRLAAQGALVLAGATLITLGTLASRSVWLGTVVTVVVAFAVLFSGVVSSVLAGSSTALLAVFILSVTLPGTVSALPDRLAGWTLAGAAAMIAIGLLWPAPAREPLRSDTARSCALLARRLRAEVDCLRADFSIGRRVALAELVTEATAAVTALRTSFFGAPYRPTGLSTETRTLVRLIDEVVLLQAVLERMPADGERGMSDAAVCELKLTAADLLERGADLLESAEGEPDALRPDLLRLQEARAVMERTVTSALPVPYGSITAGDPCADGTGSTAHPEPGADGTGSTAHPRPDTVAAGGTPHPEPGTGTARSGAGAANPGTTHPRPGTDGTGGTTHPEPGTADRGGTGPVAAGGTTHPEPGTGTARSGAGAANPGAAEPSRSAVAGFVSSLEPGFRAQEMSFAISAIAMNIELTVAARRRTWWQRLLGRRPEGVSSQLSSAQERAGAHVEPHSVWLHNSVRGAIALGTAVMISELTGVQHSFWVAFGTMAVLRSSALLTGQNALRAVLGTVVGIVIGGGLIYAVGSDTTVLWVLLPVAIVFSGLAPAAFSFAAGQAGFTAVLLILFNIISPAGWTIGLVRFEDVAIGCAVSVGVGALFWPRGAGAALGRATADALSESARYLRRAIEYGVTRCDALVPTAADPADERRDAAAAARRLDDAFRGFLAERGTKHIPLAEVTVLLTTVAVLRLTADAVLDLWSRDDGSPAGDRTAARTVVLQAGAELCAWYQTAAAALVGHGTVPDPLGPARAADDRLVDAVRRDLTDSHGHGQGQGTCTAIRIIWTADHLDVARRLQTALIAPARAAATLQTHLPLSPGRILTRFPALAARAPRN